MGHYELMSEMALGRRRGKRSGRVINRYGEEEGERREREAELAQLPACCRRVIIRGRVRGDAQQEGEQKEEKKAKGKGIQCYNDRYGRYGEKKLAWCVLVFTKRMTTSVASAVRINLLSF